MEGSRLGKDVGSLTLLSSGRTTAENYKGGRLAGRFDALLAKYIEAG